MKRWVGSRVKAYAKIEELMENSRVLKRCLLAVYNQQEADEQEDARNYGENRKGFDNWQTIKLTKICKKLLSKKKLTGEEQECIEQKIPHYKRQIFRLGLESGDIEQLSARRYTFVY